MKTQKIQLKAFCEKAADGSLRVIATDETMDRSGESIPFESWDLTNFSKSPRLLIDHDYSVKSIVGKAANVMKDEKLRALTFEPIFHDITQAARDTKELVDGGWLDTVSVGFLRGKDAKGNMFNELMEVSFVAVPANANARVLSVKDISGDEQKAVEAFVEGEKDAKAEGDACTLEDGTEGVMVMGEDGSLSCAVRPVATEEEKGMTEDVSAAHQEMMEVKYKYIDALYTAFWAFCDAYYSDAVAPGDVKALVSEMVAKMTETAEKNPEDLTQQSPYFCSVKSFVEARGLVIEEKSGRVLSQKNRGIISTAKDALASGIVALEELLKATESAEEVTSEGDEEAKAEKPASSREDKSYQRFIELRKVMRAVNSGISEALKDAKL